MPCLFILGSLNKSRWQRNRRWTKVLMSDTTWNDHNLGYLEKVNHDRQIFKISISNLSPCSRFSFVIVLTVINRVPRDSSVKYKIIFLFIRRVLGFVVALTSECLLVLFPDASLVVLNSKRQFKPFDGEQSSIETSWEIHKIGKSFFWRLVK